MSNNCFFANICFLLTFFLKQLKDGTATPPVRPKEQDGCFLVRDDLKPKTKQKTLEVKTNILSLSSSCKEHHDHYVMWLRWTAAYLSAPRNIS